MVSRQHTTAAMAVLAAAAALLPACVSDGPPPAPRPTVREVPAPRGLTPDRLVLAVSDTPLDRDGDTYADTFEATVYLFASRADLPFHADGSFRFVLIGRTGERLAEWTLDGQQIADSRMRTIVGEGYTFRLDLNDADGDRIDARRATLLAAFTPTGMPTPVSASTSVRVGRLGAG